MGKYIFKRRIRMFGTKDTFVVITERQLKSIKGGCRVNL